MTKGTGSWDLEVRPQRVKYVAYAAAAVIIAVHVTVGALLKIGATGVIFQTADQVSMALLGIILGIVALAQSKGRPQTNGRNMAIAGIVIGAITLIVGLVGFVVLVDWASRQDPTL